MSIHEEQEKKILNLSAAVKFMYFKILKYFCKYSQIFPKWGRFYFFFLKTLLLPVSSERRICYLASFLDQM